jgi:hypothetical protein
MGLVLITILGSVLTLSLCFTAIALANKLLESVPGKTVFRLEPPAEIDVASLYVAMAREELLAMLAAKGEDESNEIGGISNKRLDLKAA